MLSFNSAEMGNADSHDYLPVWDPEHKVLDLRNAVSSHDEYLKHLKGESSDFCLADLPSNILEEISLYEVMLASFNCLSSLPSPLPLHLPHLNHIDLSHNRLMELPDSFGLLFHLRIVILDHNQLRILPDSICNLRKLEKVDLSYNRLTELPSDLGNLCELQKLNVGWNRLKKLPQSLVQCRCLKVILAVNNLCVDPPQDVCDLGSRQLLSYIKKKFVMNLQTSCRSKENVFTRVRCNQLQSPILNAKCTKVQYAQVETDTENTPSRIKTPLMLPYNASTLSSEDLKDRIIGLIYGAVIGDALGLATDFMTADECHFHYDSETLDYSQIVTDHHRVHWSRGSWGTNGDVMLIVLDSIIHWAGVVDELDFAQRLLHWSKFGLLENSNPGYTTSPVINKVLSMEDFTVSPHSSAMQLLKSGRNGVCGPESMLEQRVAGVVNIDDASLSTAIILGVPHFHNLREVVSNSIRICKATHASQQNIAANVTVSCLVALLLQGKHNLNGVSGVQEVTDLARLLASEHLLDVDYIKQFNACFTTQSSHAGWDSCHPFTALSNTVQALHSCRDIRKVLPQVVMEGGHSSLTGCLVGALCGCATGFRRLPSEWVQGLLPAHTHWLNGRINTLLDMMGIP